MLRSLLRGLAIVAMPFVTVLVGAGVSSLGLTYSLTFLIWAGLILVAVGVIWVIVMFLFLDAGSDW